MGTRVAILVALQVAIESAAKYLRPQEILQHPKYRAALAVTDGVE